MWQAVIAISSEETCLGLRLSCPLWANLPALQEDPSSVLPKHHLPQPATSPLTKAVSAKPELACGRDAACYMKEESNLAHYTKVDLLDNRILKCHTMVYLKLLSSLMYVFFFFTALLCFFQFVHIQFPLLPWYLLLLHCIPHGRSICPSLALISTSCAST